MMLLARSGDLAQDLCGMLADQGLLFFRICFDSFRSFLKCKVKVRGSILVREDFQRK